MDTPPIIFNPLFQEAFCQAFSRKSGEVFCSTFFQKSGKLLLLSRVCNAFTDNVSGKGSTACGYNACLLGGKLLVSEYGAHSADKTEKREPEFAAAKFFK